MEVIKKVLANALTLSRIPLTLLFIIAFNKNIFLEIVILFLIILTDFIDGKISRKLNVTSKLGSILDAYCDLFYVLCTSILFNIYNLLSITYTFVIVLKFIEFNITSHYIGGTNSKIPFKFDKVGRVVTALYQGVPLMVIIPSSYNLCYLYINLLIVGTFISSATRIFSLFKIKNSNYEI